jgi:EmrB/QacA subfamily drug resistance transporter
VSSIPSTRLNSKAPPDYHLDPKRWLILAIVAGSQLMATVDFFIVNIALPKAQADLGFSVANRQWVLTAYSLAFGGLLLLGGRIADFSGRKRTFIIGLIGFAAASALGGAAPDSATLFAARALQGGFAALFAPAALSIISLTFIAPKERAKAFGVYGAVSGGGAAVGLILGGILTEYASWRWCLLINTPIAIIIGLSAWRVLHESKASGKAHLDIPGALLVTLGLTSAVYAFTQASSDGWSSGSTIISLALAVVLLAAFFAVQARVTHPLLPLRVILDRNRGGSFAVSFLSGGSIFAMFLFLAFYFQQTLGYSPIRSGLAFLPFTIGLIVSAAVASQLLPRVGPKIPMLAGLVITGAGLLYLTRIGVSTSWWTHVLPAELLISIGFGQVFVPLTSTALIGVHERDAGVASALVNTTQQIGGSLGIALLNTVATSATAAYLLSHGSQTAATAAVAGYHHAFAWGAGGIALAFIATLFLRAGKDDLPTPDPAPARADPAPEVSGGVTA